MVNLRKGRRIFLITGVPSGANFEAMKTPGPNPERRQIAFGILAGGAGHVLRQEAEGNLRLSTLIPTREPCAMMANFFKRSVKYSDGCASRNRTARGQLPELVAPVAAYDAFAPRYRAYSERRKPYLHRVEEIVIAEAGTIRSLQ